ncbi:heme ABC transporter ATP-binding protein [Marinobacter sp. CHS3-4]|uniref:heme ABC transporter ATP-binding protein n=1 Tax=Marinobacter sp. CHS3-4 TaxID=3045174 RepID=UPI0024B57A64|nr:heme ABC transporter ATP-binding protein [Marinobacter sp. CHS3-4]MDI9244463.1 heme ABC transporter ATP-binding protein [Marinobacter sp. CHS3-4]
MLSVRNLNVSLGGTRIVTGIDLELGAGELVMLLGPNGAGKSTFLKALSGETQYHGSVLLSGCELTRWQPQRLARRRAVMPQRVDVNFPLTVKEVVRLGRPRSAPVNDLVVLELLRALELEHLVNRMVPGLSGGEQQRLQLARVLAQIVDCPGESLLLLDECTSALDPAHQQLVLELVRHLARKRDMAVLAIVHDLNLAAQFGDRLMLMESGRCVLDGRAEQVLTPANLKLVYGFHARIVHLPEGYPMVIPTGRVASQTAPSNPVCRQAS